jgi:uncharacterized protein (DUF1015 family)
VELKMDIRPFQAYRYDTNVAGDVAKCIAPPYDVIDEALQSDLYDRSDYNIVRVIKGKAEASDSQADNVYTRAAASFNQWVSSGALKSDAVPAIYAYVQNFQIEGEDFQRSGFVALGKLSEFGKGVQPHEKTLDGPKADRLNLMRATAAQFGQIFMLYDDPKMVADEVIGRSAAKPSLMDFCDDNDVRHRLFAVDNQEDVTAVAVMMNDKHPVIADGHHRYETALNYYYETQNPDAQFRMMTFVNMRNEGLVVLATHRLVANLAKFDINDLTAKLAESFEIAEFAFTGDADKRSAEDKMFASMKVDFAAHKNSFGIYAADGKFYKAILKDASVMDIVCEGASRAAKGLDVNVLHSLILDKNLGIGEKELAAQSNIAYIKDIGPAVEKSIAKVDSGESQVVLFMNPTKVEQIRDVAAAGEKMPQKSTFFYPKVFTGLVINKL